MSDWEEVTRPVLPAILELEREPLTTDPMAGVGVAGMDPRAVQDRSGVKGAPYFAAVTRLVQAEMISWQRVGLGRYAPVSVKPEGMRALKEWPTSNGLAEALPKILEQLAESVDDEKSGTVLDRAANVLQGVAIGTITGVIQSQI